MRVDSTFIFRNEWNKTHSSLDIIDIPINRFAAHLTEKSTNRFFICQVEQMIRFYSNILKIFYISKDKHSDSFTSKKV